MIIEHPCKISMFNKCDAINMLMQVLDKMQELKKENKILKKDIALLDAICMAYKKKAN